MYVLFMELLISKNEIMWLAFKSLLKSLDKPILLIGDFNQIEYHTNKFGGSDMIKGWEEFVKWKMGLGSLDITGVGSYFHMV